MVVISVSEKSTLPYQLIICKLRLNRLEQITEQTGAVSRNEIISTQVCFFNDFTRSVYSLYCNYRGIFFVMQSLEVSFKTNIFLAIFSKILKLNCWLRYSIVYSLI